MRTRSVLSRPGFVADPNSLRHDTGRQVDWDAWGEEFRLTPGAAAFDVVVGAAGAAQGATTVPVDALAGALPDDTVLDFGGGKFARLNGAAAAGATSLTVDALPTALVDDDTATYAGTSGQGSKQIPAGTAVAEDADGKLIPRSDADAAFGVLLTPATQDSKSDALTGYGVLIGGHLYENLLPGYLAADGGAGGDGEPWATVKTELGALFTWQTYVDSRLT